MHVAGWTCRTPTLAGNDCLAQRLVQLPVLPYQGGRVEARGLKWAAAEAARGPACLDWYPS